MGGGAESQVAQKERKITLEELSQHREMNDAWVSMRGKVYDVSGWADHPGKWDATFSLVYCCLRLEIVDEILTGWNDFSTRCPFWWIVGALTRLLLQLITLK